MDKDHEQHAHDDTIRPRTQLPDQLPSSFEMENLLKRRDNRVIASVEVAHENIDPNILERLQGAPPPQTFLREWIRGPPDS